ncbi:hypothetical protein V5F59_17700 [Xanthobacter autotrophicus DSM 431]|uniref:hypothetical protein n=1 Tax=Xanthobacter nonsaccharivorans TaxID=3119912 RepID=UPI0037266EBE
MTVQMILLPLFVHVVLVFAVLLKGLKGGEVTVESVRGALAALLFYALTALSLFTRKADVLFVLLAWVFVALRVAAVFPEILSARARGRVSLDGISIALLAVMWAIFILAVLLNI